MLRDVDAGGAEQGTRAARPPISESKTPTGLSETQGLGRVLRTFDH